MEPKYQATNVKLYSGYFAFSVPILKRVITRRQVDNKIRRIERRFKNRNDNRQKSGAGNLSQWNLEERVGATIGDQPTVHVETISSLHKDNSKGKLRLLWCLGGGETTRRLCTTG